MKFIKRFGLPSLVAAIMCGAMLAPAGASATVGDPILFVHGYGGSASQFDSLKGRFSAAGWTSGQMATVSYGKYTKNEAVASKVSTAVNALLAANPGKSKVDLVSHSMGGLGTRYYVKNLGGAAKVKTFVSLAGPNHGTNVSYWCAFIFDFGCLQMVPGSSFLKALNAGDETPGAVNYATWWSPDDGTILPPTSTILNGAQNTQVAGVSHNAQFTDATVGNGAVAYVVSH